MKRNGEGKEYSLRFLVIRAVAVFVVVVAALLALRFWGVTVQEEDVPANLVEELTQDAAASAAASYTSS